MQFHNSEHLHIIKSCDYAITSLQSLINIHVHVYTQIPVGTLLFQVNSLEPIKDQVSQIDMCITMVTHHFHPIFSMFRDQDNFFLNMSNDPLNFISMGQFKFQWATSNFNWPFVNFNVPREKTTLQEIDKSQSDPCIPISEHQS